MLLLSLVRKAAIFLFLFLLILQVDSRYSIKRLQVSDPSVVKLTFHNFSSFVEAHELTMVLFYVETSVRSYRIHENFIQVALAAKNESIPVRFAQVDGLFEKELTMIYSIMKFPTIKFFHKEEPIVYTGGKNEEMLQWVRARANKGKFVLTPLQSEDQAKEFFDETENFSVVFVGDEESEELKVFRRTAFSLFENASFAFCGSMGILGLREEDFKGVSGQEELNEEKPLGTLDLSPQCNSSFVLFYNKIQDQRSFLWRHEITDWFGMNLMSILETAAQEINSIILKSSQEEQKRKEDKEDPSNKTQQLDPIVQLNPAIAKLVFKENSEFFGIFGKKTDESTRKALQVFIEEADLFSGRIQVVFFEMTDQFSLESAGLLGVSKKQVDPPVLRLFQIQEKMIKKFITQIEEVNKENLESFFTKYPENELVYEMKSQNYPPIQDQSFSVKTLTAKTFDEAIFGVEQSILVLLYLKTCKHSKYFLKIYQKLATEFENQKRQEIVFTKFDAAKNELIDYSFIKFPTLLLFKGEIQPEVFDEEVTFENVENWIERQLAPERSLEENEKRFWDERGLKEGKRVKMKEEF